MSVTWHCDWCGEEIENESVSWVLVDVQRADEDEDKEERQHYHLGCWDELIDYVEFNRKARAELEALPVRDEPVNSGLGGAREGS